MRKLPMLALVLGLWGLAYSPATAVPAASIFTDNCRKIKLAIAADYSLYQFYGREQTANYVNTILNIAAQRFDDEFSHSIEFEVTELLLVSCQDCTPWEVAINPEDRLPKFQQWAVSENGFASEFDAALLWTQAPPEGMEETSGYSFGTLPCGGLGFSLVRDVPGLAIAAANNVSHQLGHLLGAVDDFPPSATDACANAPVFLMHPTITANEVTGWSAEAGACTNHSIDAINDWLSQNCLEGCANEDCNALQQLRLEHSPDGDSITISWEAEEQAAFTVFFEELDSTRNKSYSVFTNQFSLALEAEDFCKRWLVRVQADCTVGPGFSRSLTFRAPCPEVTSTTSVAKPQQTLFPNPTQGELQLGDVEPMTNYEVYNVTGARITNGTYLGSPLDFSFLPPGLYHLRMGRSTLRFVKQ